MSMLANSAASRPPDFLTDNLALSSWLVTEGHEPALHTMGTKFLFAFRQSETLTANVAAFHDGSARVDPNGFNEARISLRKRMTANTGGGGQ